LFNAAELDQFLATRLCQAHARAQIVFDVQLEMALQLRGEIFLSPLSAEESAQTQKPCPQTFHNGLCHLQFVSLNARFSAP